MLCAPIVLLLALLASPEAERMLLGPSPFFRVEGMERALVERDHDLLVRAAEATAWDARRLAALALGPRTPPALLKDPVASVREAAILALDLAAPEELLLPLLTDADDAVRAAAVWALRGRGTHAAMRALQNDPRPTVAATALAATAQFSRLRTLAAKDDLAIALPAIIALGRAGEASDARFLLDRLTRAVREAGAKKAPMLYFRSDPNSDVAVARAVGEMARRGVSCGGKTLAEHLRRLVDAEASDTKGSSALLLAEAVAGARDIESARRILDAIVRLMKVSTQPTVYFEPAVQGILHSFARDPWPELAPLLLPLLGERELSVRLAAVGALSGNAARLGLRDKSPLVRAVACAGIDDADVLVEATRDRDASVVAAAARSLGRRGGPGAAEALLGLLGHAREEVRLAAVGALLRVDAPERAERLYDLATRDQRAAVRAAATAVLGFLEDESTLGRAVADLSDGAEGVRAAAIAFLHARGDARLEYDPSDPAAGAERWGNWWKERSGREPYADAFRYHIEDLRRRGLDVVLVLDATSSMARVIQATKRRIVIVVERLRRVVPDLRLRVVAFRDTGDTFVTIASPLTHDTRLLEDFLAGVPADGGGDAPEAVLAGLREAIARTPWRENSHRVVLLFGDAPPHDRDMTLLEAIVKEFSGAVHTVDASGYGLGGGATGNEPAFRSIATWGKGAFLRLGSDLDLLRAVLVLILGPEHRAAVETLFGL